VHPSFSQKKKKKDTANRKKEKEFDPESGKERRIHSATGAVAKERGFCGPSVRVSSCSGKARALGAKELVKNGRRF